MKPVTLSRQFFLLQLTRWLLCLAALLFVGSTAQAGLTFELHILRYNHGQSYRFFTPLYTNSTPAAAAFGTYLVSSPLYTDSQSTNGSWRAIVVDANGANTVDGRENGYNDFNTLMNQLTNGPWTMVYTNNTTTNVYRFTITAPTAVSNMLPAVVITFPFDGSINVTNQPTLTWQPLPGFPAWTTNSYVNNYDFSSYETVSLPPGQNSWTVPSPLSEGVDYYFNLTYITNDTTTVFAVSTPVDTNSLVSLSGWSSFDTLDTGDQILFAVTNSPTASASLIAHYTFDNSGNLGKDTSGNGYDLDFNGGNGVTSTNDAWLGGGAAYFDGGSFFSYTSTPANVLNALAANFSISFWIKTTQDDGNEDGQAFEGAGIVAADVPGSYYDLVPAALDGGQIGFNTGPYDDTLNTTTNVNTPGSGYHHVVVTRNQATGEKQIYVDGQLNQSDFATQNPLSDPRLVAIGCGIDASQSDPNNADPHNYFEGALDDLQIYSGVLSAAQVTQLYRGTADNSLVAHYSFDNSANIGADISGHGLDLNFNGGNGVTSSSDAETGGGAANFDGGSFLSYNSAPGAVLNAFAGDFTLSFWIKTLQNPGDQGGPAYGGAGIVTADIPFGPSDDIIPAALDGRNIGFNTGPGDDTLNANTTINDGNYHHVVVTRIQSTGEKEIYIDGNLDNSDFDTTDLLNAPVLVAVGCKIDASQSDPNDADPQQFFQGKLDDLQIYSRTLSSTEITYLFNNPGATIKPSSVGHLNVAHFTFDDSNDLGHDSSGNANDFSGISYWGPREQPASDAVAGGGSLRLFGTSSLSASDTTRANIDAVLAGSFTFSVWAKTTVTNGTDGNNAFFGAVIFWAYNDHNNTNDTIPLSIAGSRAAFTTRGSDSGASDTLSSFPGVNDGNYHLITVTRDGNTGEKKMYVDGNLADSQIGTTQPLNGNDYYMSIGGAGYILNTTATVTNYSAYSGLLDDLQIYSGVLSPNDVTYLYSNPGSTVADVIGSDFNAALNTSGLNWNSGGDAAWFAQSAVTHDGISAAQSGRIADSKSSYLDVTSTVNGQVSFYWKVSSEDTFDFLHFYINGNEQAAISGNKDWTQKTYLVSAGDVLRWEYTKDDSTSEGEDAGFLDQVTFTAITPLVITVNPFNQTNYPGYNVALLAAATGNPTPTYQWYKTGTGLITNATNGLYLPTNSGSASVAGDYYAIASTPTQSAITTTASVTFVSAPLPPDWSRAFKSPFYPVDDTTTNYDYYYGCVVDASGNIYAAAEFNGAMTVGSQTLISGNGGDAAAVVKQAPDGTPLWAVGITNNGSAHSYAECVATAPGGGVYVSGNFGGNNWLGSNHLADAGGGDMFLARFDASGSNVWFKTFGGTNLDFTLINSLASDSSGNVTVCGLLGAGPVSIGSSNYNVVNQEGILIQLDPTGTILWSQILPSEFPQYLTQGGGRLYLSVNTTVTGGTTNVVVGGVSNITDRTWAVACLSPADGHAIWVRGVGTRSGSGTDNPYTSGVIDDVPRIAAAGPNVFITGVAYDTTAAFGGLTVNFDLPRGQYFARYDTNGNAQVATTYGSVTTTPLAAVANTNGFVYVAGDFDTYSIFGSNMIAAPVYPKLNIGAFSQAFLAKFDSNGVPVWARAGVAPDSVNFLGLSLAADGVWASGWGVSSNLDMVGPINFGTNHVFTDVRALVGGAGGSTYFLFYPGGLLAKVTDSVAVSVQPLTLINPRNSGTNFQFSFQSQSGVTHAVQYRTNLLLGADWQTYTNVSGDDSLQTLPIPYSIFSPSKSGFIRVKSQ